MTGARGVGLAGNQQQRETGVVELELLAVQDARQRRAARPMLRIMIVIHCAGRRLETPRTKHPHPREPSFATPGPSHCGARAPSAAHHECPPNPSRRARCKTDTTQLLAEHVDVPQVDLIGASNNASKRRSSRA